MQLARGLPRSLVAGISACLVVISCSAVPSSGQDAVVDTPDASTAASALSRLTPQREPNYFAGLPDESHSTVQTAPRVTVSRVELSRPVRELPSSMPLGETAEEIEHRPALNPNEAGLLVPQHDPVVQTSIAPHTMMPTALQNIWGQGETTSQATITGTPPDTNGAVGPNHYVQAVNGGLAIWNKAGTLVWGSQLLNMLWKGYTGTNAGNQCATRNDGDPVVVYDQLADRWFITQFSVPNKAGPDYQCVAVSQTSDPTGAYYLYDFQYPYFNDYGKFGIWPDAYYATFNDFTHKYGGADLCAYDRASMLAGKPATQVCFVQPTSVFGVLPVSLDGAVPPPRGEPGFFMDFDTNSLNLWKLHVDFTTTSNSTLTGPTSIPVAAFTSVASIAEPGAHLDSLADRLMFRLAYRNFGTHEALTVNHTVSANNASGVRWYEIWSPDGTPVVHQQGTYAPSDGLWRWMGSLAQDQAQNFALGFSTSSNTQDPAIAWTGRLQSDALGTLGATQGEAIVDVGTGSETGATRWGDYSNMTVDPTDDCTFWFTSEDYHTTGMATWDTRIASFRFPTCAQNDFSLAIAPASQNVAQSGSAAYTVTTALTRGAAEPVALNVQDLPTGVTGTFAPTTVNAGGMSKLTLSASGTAPLVSSVMFTVIGTAPSALHFATASVSVTPQCVPVTTCPAGANCGTAPDGCGGSIPCGTCGTGQQCVANQCQAVTIDAGSDAGVSDAGIVDSSADGAVADSGSDAAQVDSGADGGASDSGSASGSDSGSDSGSEVGSDSGTGSDASGGGSDQTDSGTGHAASDSGADDATAGSGSASGSGDSGGCGCRVAEARDASSSWTFAGAALALVGTLRLRRRRRQSASSEHARA